MKEWILENIDSAPVSLQGRMQAMLHILESNPSYNPPLDKMQAELARYHSRGAPIAIVPCPPHAAWCPRFGLPTGPHACGVCTEQRDWHNDEVTPLERAEFTNWMRWLGINFGAVDCQHLRDTGRTVEQKCCGGKVKQIPVMECGRTGKVADCRACRDKALAG